MRLTIVLVLFLLLGCQRAVIPADGVQVASVSRCGNADCYNLKVTCGGIPAREVLVRVYQPGEPKGSIILTTGGLGGSLYSEQSENARNIVTYLMQKGYAGAEVAWTGRMGWATNAEGHADEAFCGFAEVARWLEGIFVNNERICAHGNSGGSAQIAYGLSFYGLDEVLDMVVLSGGPPMSRIDVACFGSDKPGLADAKWGEAELAARAVDHLMGREICNARHDTEENRNALRQISLLNGGDYELRTKVKFVNSVSDPTNADAQARLYYDALIGPKNWYAVQEPAHAIFNTREGMETIKQLLAECGD